MEICNRQIASPGNSYPILRNSVSILVFHFNKILDRRHTHTHGTAAALCMPLPLPPHLCTRHCCVVSEPTHDSSNELLVVQKLLSYLTDELTNNIQYTIENVPSCSLSHLLLGSYFREATKIRKHVFIQPFSGEGHRERTRYDNDICMPSQPLHCTLLPSH